MVGFVTTGYFCNYPRKVDSCLLLCYKTFTIMSSSQHPLSSTTDRPHDPHSSPRSHAPQLRVSYAVTILAGLLLATIVDRLFQANADAARIPYKLYELFFGLYSPYRLEYFLSLMIPLVVVNLLNYTLYRSGRFVSERLFFFFLSIFLNGVIFFAVVNRFWLIPV